MEICERLDLERDAVDEYHQLGMVAQWRQQFDLAEQWYKKALAIRERLGLERDAASDYHQLGIVAQARQQFDLAEQWYKKALEIYERLSHPPLLVDTLAQLGVLRRKQEKYADAVAWFGRALAIASEFHMRVGLRIVLDLGKILESVGEEEFTTVWQQSFKGQDPPLKEIREIMKKWRNEKDEETNS